MKATWETINMKINKDGYYSAEQIMKLGLFPWIKSINAIKAYIKYDLANKNRLKTKVKPGATKHGTRYFIKGSNIIKLIAKFEDGSLFDGR